MTTQFDFTDEEWSEIATAPLLVGIAVAKAEDSGFFGSIRETKTLAATIAGDAPDNAARPLIESAAATETKSIANAFNATAPEALADAAVIACREVAALLDRTADDEEAEGYKQWILDIARSVAEAAKETAVRTSPAEAALIERVAQALNRPV